MARINYTEFTSLLVEYVLSALKIIFEQMGFEGFEVRVWISNRIIHGTPNLDPNNFGLNYALMVDDVYMGGNITISFLENDHPINVYGTYVTSIIYDFLKEYYDEKQQA